MSNQSQQAMVVKLHAALGAAMALIQDLETEVAEYRATNRQLAAQLLKAGGGGSPLSTPPGFRVAENPARAIDRVYGKEEDRTPE